MMDMIQNKMADFMKGGQSYTGGWKDYYNQPGTTEAPPPIPSDPPTTYEDPYSYGGVYRHGGVVSDRSNAPGGAEPIMAHEGEMVMTPEATRQYRPELEQMNRGFHSKGLGQESSSRQPMSRDNRDASRSPREQMGKVKRMILEFHRGRHPDEP